MENPAPINSRVGLRVMVWLGILAQVSVSEKAPSVAVTADPFVDAIEDIKRSVGSLVCLEGNGGDARVLKHVGSGFLISEYGDFLTAAHVVAEMTKTEDPCPASAIIIADANWRPELLTEELLFFPFKPVDCRLANSLDVALCRPSMELRSRIHDLHKAVPVQFEWNVQPDGTQLAFTGFPLEARDPITFRAHVAAHQTEGPHDSTPQLMLDHGGLPGFSGSPAFLANRKVVAIMVRDGQPNALGVSIARPVSAFREMLTQRPAK